MNINNSRLILLPVRLLTIALFACEVFLFFLFDCYYYSTVLIGQKVHRIAAEFSASDCPGGNDLGFGHPGLKRRPGHSLLYFRVLRGLQAEVFAEHLGQQCER